MPGDPAPGSELIAQASRSLVAAVAAATALSVAALVARTSIDLPDGSPLPDRLMAVLVAGAGLCIAGLTVRRAPAVAWLAATCSAGIAAVEIVAVSRAAEPLVDAESRPALLALGAAALVAGVCVAAAYAARPRLVAGRVLVARALTLSSVVAVAVSALTTSWAVAAGPMDAGSATPIRMAARLSLGLVVLGIVVGVARDLSGPVGRALDRRRAQGPVGSEDARRSFLSLLGDELLPGRSGERRRGAESERARLAADIHALVLPDLRRAAAAAESRGVSDDVASGVRRSLEGIEQLMHERQSIVLEEFGLVAALEWLAERTEERGTLRVELELDGDRVDDRSAAPPEVSRVAFRVALLALDNVVRHAGASIATVHLWVTMDALRLSIVDDGRGPDMVPAGRGGRGLADMRTDAAAVGAELRISRLERGTRVDLAWPRGVRAC